MAICDVRIPPKVDLDACTTAYVDGARPKFNVRHVPGGTASGEDRSDPYTMCIEVGDGGPRCYDHHSKEGSDKPACLQALEHARVLWQRQVKICEYVGQMDRGQIFAESSHGFPTLSQLFSGMLLDETLETPEQRFEQGLLIIHAVVESGINPFKCMEPILDLLPRGRHWAELKKEHNKNFEEVIATAKWYTTKAGRKLAVVESTWIGAPRELYKRGADIIVALNPAMSLGLQKIRKFTVATRPHSGVVVAPAMDRLNSLESGWGGPTNGTICGSRKDASSNQTLEEVVNAVIETM